MKFDARKFLSGLMISLVFSNVCIAKNMEGEALDLIRTRVYDELNLELFSVSFENNPIPSTVDEIFNKIQQEIDYNLSNFKDNIIEQIKEDRQNDRQNYKSEIKPGNIDLSIYDLAIQILERKSKKPKPLAYDSLADGNHVIERLIHDYADRVRVEQSWCVNVCIAKNMEGKALDLIRTCVYDELNLELFSVSFENNPIPSTVDEIFNKIQQEIDYNLSDFKDNIIEKIQYKQQKELQNYKSEIKLGKTDLQTYGLKKLAIKILERKSKKPETLAYDSLADGNHVIERLIHDYANRVYTKQSWCVNN